MTEVISRSQAIEALERARDSVGTTDYPVNERFGIVRGYNQAIGVLRVLASLPVWPRECPSDEYHNSLIRTHETCPKCGEVLVGGSI